MINFDKFQKAKNMTGFLLDKLLFPVIIGIVISISSLWYVSKIQKEKEQIIIGFTAHSTFETESHKKLLIDNMTNPVNNILGELEKKYEFTPIVVGSSKYNDVFKGLNTGYVDLAFLSPYAYLEKVFQKDTLLNRCIYVGKKRSSIGNHYYSGITVPKKLAKDLCMISYSELQNSKYCNLNTLLNGVNVKFILNEKKNSTSTHVIPKLILYYKDYMSNDYIYLSRKNMISLLLNQNTTSDSLYIGFLANEDWIYACKQNKDLKKKYTYIYFDEFPIPYDPVFANKKWYNNMKENDELDRVWRLLRLVLNTNDIENNSTCNNNWLKHNSEFIDLVFSGMVEKHNSDTVKIVFHDNNIQRQFIDSLKNPKWKVCFVKRKTIDGKIVIDTLGTNNLVDARWEKNIAYLKSPVLLKGNEKILAIVPEIYRSLYKDSGK